MGIFVLKSGNFSGVNNLVSKEVKKSSGKFYFEKWDKMRGIFGQKAVQIGC